MESSVYHPRANGLAEGAVQTVKRALQAWSPNLNVSFGAFPQRALMTIRYTSKTRSKTPVELLLGLPAIAHFDLLNPFYSRPTKRETVPAAFIIRKGLNTSFIHPENSTRTIVVSDNQIARLDEDNLKTETTSVGGHISIRTTTSEHRCGTLTSGGSVCSHISCRAQTTWTTRVFSNINKKQKTTRQIWRTYTHKLA